MRNQKGRHQLPDLVLSALKSEAVQTIVTRKKRISYIKTVLLISLILVSMLLILKQVQHSKWLYNTSHQQRQIEAYNGLSDTLEGYDSCMKEVEQLAEKKLSSGYDRELIVQKMDCMQYAHQFNIDLLLVSGYFTFDKTLQKKLQEVIERQTPDEIDAASGEIAKTTLAEMKKQIRAKS